MDLSTATTFSKKSELRMDNLAAIGEQFGYRVDVDEYSDILKQRTLVLRQVRAGRGVRDTELRVELRRNPQTGRDVFEARGWHHLDATNRGKKVAISAAAMWLQRHAICR